MEKACERDEYLRGIIAGAEREIDRERERESESEREERQGEIAETE